MKRFSASKSIVFTIALAVLCSAGVLASDQAQPPFVDRSPTPSVQQYFAQVRGDGLTLFQSDDKSEPVTSFDVRGDRREQAVEGGRKNVKMAFLYSLVIPGAGQLYTGSKLKAALFLGLEAMAWTGHISYHNKGKDKTTEFEGFADDHWIEDRYGDYLEINWAVRDDDSVYHDPIFPDEGLLFTHHLPDTRTQQYYEMIGKYDQFVYGWDDVPALDGKDTTAHETASSSRRLIYEDMRGEANKMYDRATTAIIVMMANHLASAFWAALDAKRHNDDLEYFSDRVSIKAVMAETERDRFPMLTMTYKF